MDRPPLEVADLVRAGGERFIEHSHKWLTWAHIKVLRAIERCRTAALGGHLDECSRCGHRVISYNSCRNRHCPKCQANARDKWLAARRRELLPSPYVHVVFTLPHELGPLALQNKKVIYGLLFRASAETLLEIASDPKHLGAEIGFFGVLHTWNQKLEHHPHVHCVVPAGGLSPAIHVVAQNGEQFTNALIIERLGPKAKDELRVGLLTPTAARQIVRLPQGNQTEVLAAIRREALSNAELGGVVDLWLRCSERRQQEYLLAHPREALTQAKGVLPAVRDPRLSEAGNQVWKRVGMLLDVLGRMEVWLAHQGRTGLTPEDRVILLPRFQRLARDAGSVAALSRDFVGELERT